VSEAPQPYQPQNQLSAQPPPTGTAYASYGTRVLAYLIDSGVDVAVLITCGLIISVIWKGQRGPFHAVVIAALGRERRGCLADWHGLFRSMGAACGARRSLPDSRISGSR
jgi:hypothetical protein